MPGRNVISRKQRRIQLRQMPLMFRKFRTPLFLALLRSIVRLLIGMPRTRGLLINLNQIDPMSAALRIFCIRHRIIRFLQIRQKLLGCVVHSIVSDGVLLGL